MTFRDQTQQQNDQHTAPPTTPDAKLGAPRLEDQLLVVLRRITRAINLRSRVLLKEIGLTSPQLAALQAIHRLQPVSAGAIAKTLHLGQPTVTGILTRLEQSTLITRTRDQADRRSVAVRLSEQGEQALSQAPSVFQDDFKHELAGLPEWEQNHLLAALQRIADMLHLERVDPVTEEAIAAVAHSTD